MKRITIACFLLVASCQKNDPPNLLSPDPKAKVEAYALEDVSAGDSRPFRLKGGDYWINGSSDSDCQDSITVSLLNDSNDAEVFSQTARIIDFNVRKVPVGIYYVKVIANNDCRASVFVIARKK